MNAKQYVTIPVNRIARESGVKSSDVRQLINDLVGAGLIEGKFLPGGTFRYTVKRQTPANSVVIPPQILR